MALALQHDAAELALQRTRLLVVDDDARLRDSLQSLLTIFGFVVSSAENGRGAIERLTREHFDVAIVNLRMPEIDGYGVLRHAREHHLETPIIIISGDTSVETVARAFQLGALDFVGKPFDTDQLVLAVQRASLTQLPTRQARELVTAAVNSPAWYHNFVDHSPDFFYVLNEGGRFTFVNRRAEELLGLERAKILGQHYLDIVHEADRERARYAFDERRTGKRASADVELRLRSKQRQSPASDSRQSVITVLLSASGIYQGQVQAANFLGTCGIARDISARKKSEERIHYQAYHDLLTGLPNRMLFRDHLVLAMAQARRSKKMLAVMFIDLDRFKLVNDTLGHSVGDQLLQAVAARLAKCVREGDTLARIGGDEFILLLPQIDDRDAARNTAGKLLDVLTSPFTFGRQEHFLGASIGIAIFPNDGESIETLIKNADSAMYEAKARGRNTSVFFTATRPETRAARVSPEQELHRGILSSEFELYYQPLVRTTDNTIVGVEALLRWNHPTRGLVHAEEFISAAEDSRLVVPLGQWVLKNAIHQVRAWQEQGLGSLRLSINLSPRQLERHDFVGRVGDLLQSLPFTAEQVQFEISEVMLLRGIEFVGERLRQLRELGVRLAIDNFGAGATSFGLLRHLPIQVVKLDRSVIADLKPSERDHTVQKALVMVARGFDLEVCAEGVETLYQRNFVHAQSCDAWQGFLFCKPISATDITLLLQQQRRLSS